MESFINVKIEPNWPNIRIKLGEIMGKNYCNAYLSDVWRKHRENKTLRPEIIKLIGEPEEVEKTKNSLALIANANFEPGGF